MKRKSDRIAVIGVGAMGSALIRGLLAAKLARPADLLACDSDHTKLTAICKELGVTPAESNGQAAAEAGIIVLAVKPPLVEPVLTEIEPVLRGEKLLVSIAAGIPLSRILPHVKDEKVKVARVMPNTPALVNAGMSAVAFAPGATDAARARVMQLFAAVGEVVEVEEKLMDAVTGLSGSGPAYVFLTIEALADGGVAAGLPRAIAQKLAIQTVLGAARLLKETGQHPAAAKDMVASPGGTTIAGLEVLEKKGLRAALIQAVLRAAERSRELSG